MGKAKPKDSPGRRSELLNSRQRACIANLELGLDVAEISRKLRLPPTVIAADIARGAEILEHAGEASKAALLLKAIEGLPRQPRPKYVPGGSHRKSNYKAHPVPEISFDHIDATEPSEAKTHQETRVFARNVQRVHDILERADEINLKEVITEERIQSDIDPRWEELEKFAIKHGGVGVAARGRQLFPELGIEPREVIDLPQEAPEIYQGLRGPESPPEFVQRVYAPWLGQGLTRAHIGKLDPVLYTAINNWLSRAENVWPEDVDLPKKSEHNSRLIEQLETEGTAALPALGAHSLKALASLEAAQRRRATQMPATMPNDIEQTGSNEISLPTSAPELYQGLRGPESPPEFVQRVYGPWLGKGLTRAHVGKLDPKLYTAINNWLSRPGNVWPDDVDLPTLKERNNREIARLSQGDVGEVLGKFTGKEAARLGAAIARRSKQ